LLDGVSADQQDTQAVVLRMSGAAIATRITRRDLIAALKVASMVNITWGPATGMLCGNPLAERFQFLDVSCSNEGQAWMINRAKKAMSNGDEAAARAHIAPMIRQPVRQ
jgi:hypothetical protein